MTTVHVVGAGLAGLSAAVGLAKAGRDVCLYEAAGHAGGRCRSYFDKTLDRKIDNGNHLLLSGNSSVQAYLSDIGATDRLAGPSAAEYPFYELDSGLSWTLRLSSGKIPWWIFSKRWRVPGTWPGDYLQALRLALAGPDATVEQCLNSNSVLYRRFWEPMAVAVLNTKASEGAAALLWTMVRETFGRGEAACRPRIARKCLEDTFVDPALKFLQENGCSVRFNQRLRSVGLNLDRAETLDFGKKQIQLDSDDRVILALPPLNAASLIPGLNAPLESRAIVNAHFLLPECAPEIRIIGLIGGTSQWLFVRGDIASVTVSAADDLIDHAPKAIAGFLWPEVRSVLGISNQALPKYRIVKEKRATFAQTPASIRLRPSTRTAWQNIFLAGDWTDIKLPASIEGALRSGRKAADYSL